MTSDAVVTISAKALAALVDVATEASLQGNRAAREAVADARTVLELHAIDARVLGWIPAARAVRQFARAEHSLPTDRRVLVSRIHHELLDVHAAQLGLDLTDPTAGVAALHAAQAVSEATVLLAEHGVIDRDRVDETATAAAYTAMAIARHAPTEVRR